MTTPTLEAPVELPKTIEPAFYGPTWKRGDDGKFVVPERSLGYHVMVWAYLNLIGPDGGPWKFTAEQARFIVWFYAVDENGDFLYREVVLQRLKGWG